MLTHTKLRDIYIWANISKLSGTDAVFVNKTTPKLDPVGSTLRYEVMKSVLGHYRAVMVGNWGY